MRLWHYKLLPYLPEAQFRGQLRELAAILHEWRDKGKTNHLLINRVMEYPKSHLYEYFLEYAVEHEKRYGELPSCTDEFRQFGYRGYINEIFPGWHNSEYLKICMTNLYEKYHYGTGKSRMKEEEWLTLCEGYYKITGQWFTI